MPWERPWLGHRTRCKGTKEGSNVPTAWPAGTPLTDDHGDDDHGDDDLGVAHAQEHPSRSATTAPPGVGGRPAAGHPRHQHATAFQQHLDGRGAAATAAGPAGWRRLSREEPGSLQLPAPVPGLRPAPVPGLAAELSRPGASRGPHSPARRERGGGAASRGAGAPGPGPASASASAYASASGSAAASPSASAAASASLPDSVAASALCYPSAAASALPLIIMMMGHHPGLSRPP